jgi:hypothetical protein
MWIAAAICGRVSVTTGASIKRKLLPFADIDNQPS